MLDIVIKGGIILWAIILLSVIAMVIVIERFLYFRKIRIDKNMLFLQVKSAMAKGSFDEAIAICEASSSPLSILFKTAIEHRGQDLFRRREFLKDSVIQTVPQLEKNIGFLGSIAHIAPLLGLLGTVTGNIKTFGVLGQFGSEGDPSILAHGISEALITTAAGLIVAIPASIFYNMLVSRVKVLILHMENQVNEAIFLPQELNP